MSGPLIQLVSQGIQDVYLSGGNNTQSNFKNLFSKSVNFSQAVKPLEIVGKIANGSLTTIEIQKKGDIVNHVWFECPDIINTLSGSTFELYIGGKLVDSQTFEYCADIWQVYLAETKVKSTVINNKVAFSDTTFFPLHFFFNDNNQFLPLVNIPYNTVEIRVKWGSGISNDVKCYANYIFLDTNERLQFINKDIDMVVTQVQKLEFNKTDGDVTLDISPLNHPVKSLFWGYETKTDELDDDYITFDSATILLNGLPLLENMSPSYFHTAQGYYNTQNAMVNFVPSVGCPFYTRFYMYSFAKDTTDFNFSGSCNFSRLDSAQIRLKNLTRIATRVTDTLYVYALNYNILKFKAGLSGILFSN